MFKNISWLLKELTKEEKKSILPVKVACLIIKKNELNNKLIEEVLTKGHNTVVSNKYNAEIDLHNHAELNALINFNLKKNIKNLVAFISLMPCYNCIKIINLKNIKEVYYINEIEDNTNIFKFNVVKKYCLLNNIKLNIIDY